MRAHRHPVIFLQARAIKLIRNPENVAENLERNAERVVTRAALNVVPMHAFQL